FGGRYLGPADGKSADREPLLRTIRTQLGAVEGAKVRLRDLSGPGRCWGCRYPVELAVYGPEEERGRALAEKLAWRLRQEQGLGATAPPHRELTATIDAAAARDHGVPTAEVFNTLRAHLGELVVGDFDRFGRNWRVTLKANPGAGNPAEELKKLRTRGADGRL